MKMTGLDEDLIRTIVMKTNVPIILKQFVKNSTLCEWSEDKWCSVFGNKEVPFRTMNRDCVSDEPCWERKCAIQNMTFKQFLRKIPSSPQWMYFDYKYLHQWFSHDNDLLKEVSWSKFGYPEKHAADTTLWVGSDGAHTPAHQDTYGVNIVTQIYGKKRWILFPPETGGLKPTRVPYEESSVYSELNFYCPSNLDAFKGLVGARCVELCAGDALVVPHGWWHYVQTTAPLSIALNTWLPHEKDGGTRVSEALIRIMIAQICKDLPQDTAKLVVNPNEDDLGDTPLAVLFLQLESVAAAHVSDRRKSRRAKRQRTHDGASPSSPPAPAPPPPPAPGPAFDLAEIAAPAISAEELVTTLESNISKYRDEDGHSEREEADGDAVSLRLTKSVVDAFCEANVIELVKQNLLARLG